MTMRNDNRINEREVHAGRKRVFQKRLIRPKVDQQTVLLCFHVHAKPVNTDKCWRTGGVFNQNGDFHDVLPSWSRTFGIMFEFIHIFSGSEMHQHFTS